MSHANAGLPLGPYSGPSSRPHRPEYRHSHKLSLAQRSTAENETTCQMTGIR